MGAAGDFRLTRTHLRDDRDDLELWLDHFEENSAGGWAVVSWILSCQDGPRVSATS